MLDEEYTEITSDIEDAAAELTNMIFGHFKMKLGEMGYELEMAIPTVISGKNYFLNHKANKPSFVIPFSSDAGNLFLDIFIDFIDEQ